MDVRLPDGTVIQNVPEGTTKAELTAKLKANGYDVSKLEAAPAPAPAPAFASAATEGMPGPRVGGVGIATAIPFLPDDVRANLVEAEQNIRGGVLRGLGSVAATARVPGVPSREAMDAYLAQTMGVNPESMAYKGGQIATEIGVGLPVPKVIGAAAARVPGLSAYAPAISSSGFNPSGLTGVQNMLGRVAGGGIAGGSAAAVINPEDAASGALIGSVLSPGSQFALGAARIIKDRYIQPAVGAANALIKAGGEDLANALRSTQGLKTTPGFTPTLAERATEAGIESPALAAMKRPAKRFASRRAKSLRGQQSARCSAAQSIGVS